LHGIPEKGAHWISRLPASVGVVMPDGGKLADHLMDNGTAAWAFGYVLEAV